MVATDKISRRGASSRSRASVSSAWSAQKPLPMSMSMSLLTFGSERRGGKAGIIEKK